MVFFLMAIISLPQLATLRGVVGIAYQCHLPTHLDMMDRFTYQIGFLVKVINTQQSLLLLLKRCNTSQIWSDLKQITAVMNTRKILTECYEKKDLKQI